MKNQSIMKTAFLLLALLGGVSTAWADTVSIPQDLGNYINWRNATTDAKAQYTDNSDGGNLGNTGEGKSASFTILNTTQQDYIISFRSSSNSCEATWSITLTNSSSDKVLNRSFVVTSTSTENWYNYSNVYSFLLSSLPADTYTLTFACTSVTSGSYGGNLKFLAICKTSDYANLPLESESKYLSFANGTATTTGNPRYVSEENTIGWIPNYTGEEAYPNNAFLDGYFVNNTTSGRYNLKFFLSYANNNDNKAKVKVTITDVRTGYNEIDGVEYDVTYSGDNKTVTLPNPISTGMKKIRFDFACKSGSCNFKNVTFALTEAVNAVILSENSNYTPTDASSVKVTLVRSISAGNWSTIVLPFDMNAEQVSSTFGTNVKLAQFTGYNSSTNELTMSEATTMNANKPYFIKVAEGEYTSPVEIQGVTIETSDNVYTEDVSGIRFQGVYASGKIPENAYFVSGNNLYKSTGSSNIKPFRAYFTNVPSGARLSFFDDEETTSISENGIVNSDKYLTPEGMSEQARRTTTVYDLQGRRVRSAEANSSLFTIHSSLKPGVYIVNGKRVIIK